MARLGSGSGVGKRLGLGRDTFYDRGSIFPPFGFCMIGFLISKASECQCCFEIYFCILGPWDSSGCHSMFCRRTFSGEV